MIDDEAAEVSISRSVDPTRRHLITSEKEELLRSSFAAPQIWGMAFVAIIYFTPHERSAARSDALWGFDATNDFTSVVLSGSLIASTVKSKSVNGTLSNFPS